ncbi:MAG: phosphorylcholine transferase LicD [Novosphingobium sp.]
MTWYENGTPSPDLLRLQAAEKAIAKELVAYCRDVGVNPFLVAGSALGAYRDGDIIAWDDDIDIGLVREEYEVLIAALRERPIPGLFLQCWRSEPGYPLAFAKLRMDGTAIDEGLWDDSQFHKGIFVDIFPFDALPRSRVMQKVQHSLLLAINLFVMSFSNKMAQVAASRRIRMLRKVAFTLRPLVPVRLLIRLREWVNRMPVARKSDDLVSFEMYGIRFAGRTRVGRDVLLPPATCRFGDLEMPVPARCEDYLRGIFGNFSELPPEEKRRPLHITRVRFDGASLKGLATLFGVFLLERTFAIHAVEIAI